jgi:hypothetical protein
LIAYALTLAPELQHLIKRKFNCNSPKKKILESLKFEMSKQSENKKRNYTSHQKLQSSIVSYTNQKKLNSNPTPPRTGLDRAFQAITDSTLKSPPKAQLRSNNPYNLLAETKEDDLEEFDESTEDLTNESEDSSRVVKTTEADADSSITNSPSKLLLSRKAQQTLKKIKSI